LAIAAVAQEPTEAPSGDRWSLSIAPYLWAAAMDGHATVGGTRSDVDVPFKDTLEDLSGGAMLLVSLEKGRFGIAADGLFARVSPDSEAGDIEIDATTDSAQLAVGPYYRLVEWRRPAAPSQARARTNMRMGRRAAGYRRDASGVPSVAAKIAATASSA